MSQKFDVIVVGVGSMGAAACYHLARRGVRVLGLEQFDIPHTRGAHHGSSRVIRKAYFEHPSYVPLLQRAYEDWAQIEADSGLKLLHRTGGIYMGRPESETIAGSLRAMQQHALPHETFDHAALARRFPMFRIPADFVGLFEADTGFLIPELAVIAHAREAMKRGAILHGHEPVLDWQAGEQGVTVRTHRDTYTADRIVFTAGAYTARLLADLGVQLNVTRQVLAWVWPKRPEIFALGQFPVWMIETGRGGQHYGFPMTQGDLGFKLALHHPGLPAPGGDPSRVERNVLPEDEETFRPLLCDFIPDADGPTLAIRTCLYTNSPDAHFIIDRHPRHPRVVLACGFSGHGFKFASVVGEALADLASAGKTDLPIDFLNLRRFA